MKERLDVLIFNKGFAESREKAKALIMAGLVFVDGERQDKAGTSVDVNAELLVKGQENKFVSRGGKKLKKAVDTFSLSFDGMVCADIGASTGGFSDCMLQNGAKKVYAVDVGYGQLAWKLRTDERVVNMERTNIRYVTEEQIPEKLDFFSVDVSFISLKLVLPVLNSLTDENALGVCLIKPQFEAGREKVGKHGVVREQSTHIEVIRNVFSYIEASGFAVKGLTFSPIKGPEGNIEYLVLVSKAKENDYTDNVEETVKTAHAEL